LGSLERDHAHEAFAFTDKIQMLDLRPVNGLHTGSNLVQIPGIPVNNPEKKGFAHLVLMFKMVC